MGRQEKEGKGIDAGPGLDEDDEQRCKELTNYVFVQSLCKFNRQEISSVDAVRVPRGETPQSHSVRVLLGRSTRSMMR